MTILEQGATIPNPLAASGDHHRIIRRAYGARVWPAITEAYAAWDEMWADLGESHLDPRGFLCVSREPGDEAEEYREGLEAGGFPFEISTQGRRGAGHSSNPVRFATHFSRRKAARCIAGRSRRVAAWLRANGANVYENSKVTSVDPETGHVELETARRYAADRSSSRRAPGC